MVEYVDDWYPSQPQYWDGWKNRYKKEKATCLAYMDQHDAEQNANGQGQTDDQPNADEPGQEIPVPASRSRPMPPTTPRGRTAMRVARKAMPIAGGGAVRMAGRRMAAIRVRMVP